MFRLQAKGFKTAISLQKPALRETFTKFPVRRSLFSFQGCRKGLYSTSSKEGKESYFEMFDCDPSTLQKNPFEIDTGALRSIYLKKIKIHHPDVAKGVDSNSSQLKSAELTRAYNTLMVPLSRAEYILQQKGISTDSENISDKDPEFLMQIMDVHEEISSNRDSPEKIEQLMSENNGRKSEEIQKISVAMSNADWELAALHVSRLRYWNTVDRILREL
ncbi:mitochondrial (2Fe-2S) cluster assembly co-chaperone Jac1 [Schizosaccharomyces osmophilus]|uniref:Mitochondrial (2Fe-2S) cluster assembly co-chaperone Jac1 n=1 Tax=Schizosaccharomyces osmophilus TaxID=2545709 RepID=A0AAF0AWT6_9SCHI|nr:mitochondrial (2Fe-2S) cluster assembly co-chaperone Jac1 [Schizosaccharomyces osmophilus]WBW73370.1 mitochondrial (2Fe-2S) cluster assembly co-chaperone Jac1 [Schizosaccharomyces osmophilus]